MLLDKPCSEACLRNREPILRVLRQVFTESGSVLEIGSGSGQHAAYFAEQLPHLDWQPSDRAENLAGIRAWVADAQMDNLRAPLELDVDQTPWPVSTADYVFSANTAHIMAWPQVQRMFTGVGALLPAGGCFCLYGPFNYDGEYSSDSNARFDTSLRNNAPHMGLRDLADLKPLAESVGLSLEADHPMPANNRTLVWRR